MGQLKHDEARFFIFTDSRCNFCLFFNCFFFSKISAISTPRTMTFQHEDYFHTKKFANFFPRFFLFFLYTIPKCFVCSQFPQPSNITLPGTYLSKRLTNLKFNEDRFSKFAFLHFLRRLFFGNRLFYFRKKHI